VAIAPPQTVGKLDFRAPPLAASSPVYFQECEFGGILANPDQAPTFDHARGRYAKSGRLS
jgi:hypothetical protein